MTNKEAITWLHWIRDQFTGNCTTDTLVPISRCDIQAIDLAIKALEIVDDVNHKLVNNSQELVKDLVKEKSERPQGEWIFRQGVTCGGYYKCNKCGEVERAEKNYCSNCGADMRGKEE